MKKELKNNNITFSFNPRTHKVKPLYRTLRTDGKDIGFWRRRGSQDPKIKRNSLRGRIA